MTRPTKVLPRDKLVKWENKAIVRRNEILRGGGIEDPWPYTRLLEIINSHEALRDRLEGEKP